MKLNKHAWIIWGIALLVTLAAMILIPFARTGAWWITACSTILMFGLCAFTFARAFRKDNSLESKLLGWPIFKVGYTALAVQIVAGAILMGIAFICPAWAAAIAELIIFAATGISLTAKDAAREFVTHSEATVEDKTTAWKAIRARAAAIADETQHPDIRRLANEIRMADPMPTSMDGQIADMLEILSSYADTANIQKAFGLLETRKTVAKAEK